MLLEGIISFEEVEYDVQSIPEEVKARIIAEQPGMANFIWDIPLPEADHDVE